MRLLSFLLIAITFFAHQEIKASFAEESQSFSLMEVVVKHVGQGNCNIVKFFKKDEAPQILLFDCGTSAQEQEERYTSAQAPLSPPKSLTLPSTPPSVKKKHDFSETVSDEDFCEEEFKSKDFMHETRAYLSGTLDSKTKLTIKTIISSHPDIDHYSLFPKLIDPMRDVVENLILCGLPQHYTEFGVFREWVKNLQQAGTKVFFPCFGNQPQDKIDDIFTGNSTLPFAKFYASKPGEQDAYFGDALNFGPEFVLSVLSLNAPAIYEEDLDQVIRRGTIEDDNEDSMVLRIMDKDNKHAVLLTGDMAMLNQKRILPRYAKEENLPFLQSTFYVASHHGASTHGSNSFEFLSKVEPAYILISNGHSKKYKHPDYACYKIFKNLKSLKRTQRHKVLVGPNQGNMKKSLRETHKAIFTTLSSGDVMLKIDPTQGYSVGTVVDKKIQEIVIEKSFPSADTLEENEEQTQENESLNEKNIERDASVVQKKKNIGEKLNQEKNPTVKKLFSEL